MNIGTYKKITLVSVVFLIILTFFYLNAGHIHQAKKLVETIENSLISGVTTQRLAVRVDNRDVIIEYFNVNTKKISSGIGISSPELFAKGDDMSKYSGFSLKEYADFGGYKIVQSGGFLSSWSPPYPLGYVKIKGKEYNGIHNTWLTKGYFCTNGRDFEIGEYKNADQFKSWPSCIQAGPIVTVSGRVVIDTRRNTGFITKQVQRQSFICKINSSHMLMGIAENVKLADLAKILVRSESDGGLGCIDTVALTGRNIAGIFSNATNPPYEVGNTDAPLPNAIVVK